MTEADYLIHETTVSDSKGTKVSRKYEKIPKKVYTKFKMVATDYWKTLLEVGSLKKDVLFHYLFSISQWKTNIVRVTANDRKIILEKLHIGSEQKFSNLLNQLKKENRIRGSNGKYMINPHLMFNGDMNTWAKFTTEGYYESDHFFKVRKQFNNAQSN